VSPDAWLRVEHDGGSVCSSHYLPAHVATWDFGGLNSIAAVRRPVARAYNAVAPALKTRKIQCMSGGMGVGPHIAVAPRHLHLRTVAVSTR